MTTRKHPKRTSVFQRMPLAERKHYGELVQIVPDGRGYTAYQRIDALFMYWVEGNVRKAARRLEISENTMLSWAQSNWWKKGMELIKESKQEELDTGYSVILEKTTQQILDRVENGEARLDPKSGELKRVPMAARDLSLVNAIAFDKRQLLRGKATQQVEHNITPEERNTILMEQFRKMAKQSVIIDITPEMVEENKYADKQEEDGIPSEAVRGEEGETDVFCVGEQSQEE